MYGKDQPIELQLLGSERSKEALEGVAMELEDSLYPLLREVRTLCTHQHARPCNRCSPRVLSVQGCCTRRLVAAIPPTPSRQVSIGIDPYEVFGDADWALMIGAKPRGPGMERADLLQQNGEIFQVQVRRMWGGPSLRRVPLPTAALACS